jgi:hypothetical protein
MLKNLCVIGRGVPCIVSSLNGQIFTVSTLRIVNFSKKHFLHQSLLGAVHKPPFTISDATSDSSDRKRRVSNHGIVKLANSACVNEKRKSQDLEEKLFGMSVRTKARSKAYDNFDTHLEIGILFDKKAKGQTKTYILAQKSLFQGKHFSDENPPTETDLQAFLNCGHEIMNLLQAAVLRAKRSGISHQLLSSCLDDCYQEVNPFSNIALPLDLEDVLDLGASMEGKLPTLDS